MRNDLLLIRTSFLSSLGFASCTRLSAARSLYVGPLGFALLLPELPCRWTCVTPDTLSDTLSVSVTGLSLLLLCCLTRFTDAALRNHMSREWPGKLLCYLADSDSFELGGCVAGPANANTD